MSDIPRKQIALQEYEKELNVFFEEVNNCISVKPKGYFLLCNKSRLYNNVTISADTSCIKMGNINLPVKIIKRLPEITLFKYNYKTSE
jgi:hypothetical protein